MKNRLIYNEKLYLKIRKRHFKRKDSQATAHTCKRIESKSEATKSIKTEDELQLIISFLSACSVMNNEEALQ